MTDSLFLPFALGDLPLPSRIVMAPMTRRRAAQGKLPTQLTALYYAQRASAALIVSESIEVDPLSGHAPPTRPGLVTEAQGQAWRVVTDAVHAAGGRIFAQLSHMGRTAHPSQLQQGTHPVGPSPIAAAGTVYTADGPQPYVEPRELQTHEVAALVQDFARSAALARQAGFDGIELHGANGYLVDQFLRDGSNHRADRYGGSAHNRAQFLLEIIAAAKQHWPVNRIGVRLSPTHALQGMFDSDPIGNFSTIVERLSGEGLAYLHVVEPSAQPEGVPYVAAALRTCFDGAFILAGKYDASTARLALSQGRADLIAFGEAFLANPDLPERLRRGTPLNTPHKPTFYTEGEAGYTDYPPLEAAQSPLATIPKA